MPNYEQKDVKYIGIGLSLHVQYSKNFGGFVCRTHAKNFGTDTRVCLMVTGRYCQGCQSRDPGRFRDCQIPGFEFRDFRDYFNPGICLSGSRPSRD
jgi:hypothetical protein